MGKKARSVKQGEMYQLLFGDEETVLPSPAKAPAAKPVETRTMTVTELTDGIKKALSDRFPNTLHVVGEVSNVCAASSGHIYFTLKDDCAQISCVMWRSDAAGLKFRLTDGLAVVVHGRLDLYPPRGQYQLYADRVTLHGVGELELAFRQLKEKLQKEGLFDPEHKIPIPLFPLTIAVVTSPTGAAVRDVLRTLELRWPVGRVLVCPVQVQGPDTAPQIAEALYELDCNAERLGVDTVILARGGGSLEDLWAFNEEVVARAIYASKLPIISGVGHEIDVTIADFVADYRAATPTAAAEAAAPVLLDVMETIRESYFRLRGQVQQALTIEKGRLQSLAGRGMFRHPIVILGPFARRFDETCQRLSNAMKRTAVQSRRQAHEAEVRLGRIAPHVVLARAHGTVQRLGQELHFAVATLLAARRNRFTDVACRLQERSPRPLAARGDHTVETLAAALRTLTVSHVRTQSLTVHHLDARLAALDYHKVLQRGFAIARRARDSKIITSVTEVGPRETIETQVADGTIRSETR